MSITYTECAFVVLGVQHAMRMLRMGICGLSCSTLFFHIVSKTARFSLGGGGYLTYEENVFWFALQLLSETFLTVRRIERDVIRNVYWSSCKVPVIPFRFYWNLNLLARFSKHPQYQISWKSVQWGPSCFTRTDNRHDAANSLLLQFCELT